MNKLKLIIGVLVFSLLSFISMNTLEAAGTEYPIYPYFIQNEEIAKLIVNDVNTLHDINDTYTQEEFETIASNVDELSLSGANVHVDVSFEGLEYFTNLEELSIISFDIDEVPQQVSGLTNLNYLRFSDNDITKIENLENLTNLETLSFDLNDITKIEGLDNLVNLKLLSIAGNDITKLEGLDNLENLERLNLNLNEIEKLEGLDSLTNLNYMTLDDNKITKLEGLDNLESLESFWINDNNIEKLEGLDNLTNLKSLLIRSNQISKMENLDNLVNLETLRLDSNQISKIEGVENLSSLIALILTGNDIYDVTELDSIRDNLETLRVNSQRFSVILPESDSYDEVFKLINCPESSCVFNEDAYTIDGSTYTDNIGSTSYDIKRTGQDDLFYMGGNGGYGTFDAYVRILPIKETIDAIDQEEHVDDAAISEEDLIDTLEANIEYDTDINDYIYVSDFDGYDVDDPKPGVYEVTFSLNNPNEGMDFEYDFSSLDKTVTYTVYIDPEITTEDNTVHKNDAPTTDDDLVLTLSTEMIDELGVEYTEDDVLTQDYKIEDYDGYDISDPQQGTYEITIKYTTELGNEVTSTSVLTVYVDADIKSNNKEVMLVDAPSTDDDILLMLDTQVFDGMNMLYTGNDILSLDNLVITDYDGYDITNPEAGMYDITITYTDENADVVSTTSTLTVLTTPQISTKDKDVMIDEAPENNDDLLTTIETKVIDEMGDVHSGKDVMDLDDCVITDMDGYDVSNPQEGTYEIEVMYTDKNGNEVSCSSMLTVMADDIESGENVDPEETVDTEESVDPEVEISDSEEENEIKQTGISYNIIVIFTLLILIITILVKKNKIT